MSARDIKVLKSHAGVQRFRTESNAYVGLEVGDAVKIGGTSTNYVIPCLDGDPEQGTDIFVGVTSAAATNTASADGVVDVELLVPGSILEGNAETVGDLDTDAKLLGLLNDFVTFSRSAATAAGILTINASEGTDTAVHALWIIDGDIVKGTLRLAIPLGWHVGTV